MMLKVNVLVTGDASEPADESLPGVYAHAVYLSRYLEPGEEPPEVFGAIAEAVINSFHSHQGIECLDDFEITVQITDGSTIAEMDDASAHECGLVRYVEHLGKVADVETAMERSRQR